MISFNIPFYYKSSHFYEEIESSAEGKKSFIKQTQKYFNNQFGFRSLLTSSCTDALEMAAILSDIQPGDEIILPSYTFVSTANAFVLRGAKLVFVDTTPDFPNIDVNSIESLITPKTKAIVCVHYGGFSCDMKKLVALKVEYGLYLIEDAAQAFDNYYIEDSGTKIPLGRIGDYGTLSFHQTKNISCGEGGLLVVNNDQFERAEIIWEKGTNRSSFHRGEINKYEWVDIGSSYLMSDITAYILLQNLKKHKMIQEKRKEIWDHYDQMIQPLIDLGHLENVVYPSYSTKNGHNFFIVLKSTSQLDQLKQYLAQNKIGAVTHYTPLHSSLYFKDKYKGPPLLNTEKFSDKLLRLPLHYYLTKNDVSHITNTITKFFIS